MTSDADMQQSYRNPIRIQQRRTKGWRLPLHAKSVARPSRWGNPFQVWRNRGWYADIWDETRNCMGFAIKCDSNLAARIVSVQSYQAALNTGWRGYYIPTKDEVRAHLVGLSLACWCPLPEPGEIDWCHARVLLDISNGR